MADDAGLDADIIILSRRRDAQFVAHLHAAGKYGTGHNSPRAVEHKAALDRRHHQQCEINARGAGEHGVEKRS